MVDQPKLSGHNAMDTEMLQCMDDDESLCFTPNEVLLLVYQHAHMMYSFSPPNFAFSSQWIPHRFIFKEVSRIKDNCLGNCNADFDDVQVFLRASSLSLNICKLMTVFLIFLGQFLCWVTWH
jgi:hypothetical protein